MLLVRSPLLFIGIKWLIFVIFAAVSVFSQSIDQNFPTPITTNEIKGEIPARKIGDSRLTSYFYIFDGGQGDVFINLVTMNFNGDIDVFLLDGLRPLTKIVAYADFGERETGRVIYLRKPERLLLRVQGRTPNDDPAMFQLKFAGSFIALNAEDFPAAPERPKVFRPMIVESKPPPHARPPVLPPSENRGREALKIPEKILSEVAPEAPSPLKVPAPVKRTEEVISGSAEPPQEQISQASPENISPGYEVVLTDPVHEAERESKRQMIDLLTNPPAAAAKPEEQGNAADNSMTNTAANVSTARNPGNSGNEAKSDKTAPSKKREKQGKKGVEIENRPDPAANLRLVVLFRDGDRLESPMTDISQFKVENGSLVIIPKRGKPHRYSLALVEKVTIE